MKLSAILRQMQEIGNEHLDAMGYTRDVLLGKNYAFLLSKLEVFVTGPLPQCGDKLRQRTAPKKPKGPFFYRDIDFIKQSDGAELITAHTAWILANPESHQIIRPNKAQLPMDYDENTDYSIGGYRPARPGASAVLGKRIIRYTDIDYNQHMNNAVYADIIMDLLPPQLLDERQLREFRIYFHNEAFLGDTLTISATQMNPATGEIQLCGEKPDGGLCFSCMLRLQVG